MKHYLRALLQPGIGVKRWSAIIFTGVAFISLGTAFALSKPLSGPLIEILRRITLYDLPQLVRGSIFAFIGIAIASLGAVRLYFIFSRASRLTPKQQDTILSLYEHQQFSRGPRIVAIGGGTGLSILIRGIKDYTHNITAIVAITDDGGSSGRLREEFEIPPPGDARACLAALSSAEPLLERLFRYRFGGDSGLGGHSLGNLMLAAMSDMEGGFQPALDSMAQMLGLHGRVVSVSDSTNLVLVAKTQSGSVLNGESAIGRSPEPIASVWIEPSEVTPSPAAVEAIRTADLIVIGPGSIYTS
ncbi:MAG: gluconeogenesis factor YvcK family protein, partial [Chloroflexota bacterium]